jgi:hypothetical protein
MEWFWVLWKNEILARQNHCSSFLSHSLGERKYSLQRVSQELLHVSFASVINFQPWVSYS